MPPKQSPEQIAAAVRAWMATGLPHLEQLAVRFRGILADPRPIDDELAGLMREFVANVEAIGAGADRSATIRLADRCGQIRAEISLRFGVDRESNWRRDTLVARGRALTGRNRGRQPRTKDRMVFLAGVAERFGPSTFLALAAEASAAPGAERLWDGDDRAKQIEAFLKKHGRTLKVSGSILQNGTK